MTDTPLITIHPPCNDYAPDTLNPDPTDRDICTNCFWRGVDHDTTTHETTELSICVDCLFLLAGDREQVEPSWCPTDTDGRTGYHNGAPCDGRCEGAVSAHAEAVDRIWAGYELTTGSVECEWCGSEAREANPDVEDCEPWFARSSCDGCGSRYGGSRVHAVAWKALARGRKVSD